LVLPGGRAELRQSAAKGRHLVARTNLRAGDAVLTVDPYCAVLNDDQRALRCDHTFTEAAKDGGDDVGGSNPGGGALLRCARSKIARYCSREAQAAVRAGTFFETRTSHSRFKG
jgi:hypothetical protein